MCPSSSHASPVEVACNWEPEGILRTRGCLQQESAGQILYLKCGHTRAAAWLAPIESAYPHASVIQICEVG